MGQLCLGSAGHGLLLPKIGHTAADVHEGHGALAWNPARKAGGGIKRLGKFEVGLRFDATFNIDGYDPAVPAGGLKGYVLAIV